DARERLLRLAEFFLQLLGFFRPSGQRNIDAELLDPLPERLRALDEDVEDLGRELDLAGGDGCLATELVHALAGAFRRALQRLDQSARSRDRALGALEQLALAAGQEVARLLVCYTRYASPAPADRE